MSELTERQTVEYLHRSYTAADGLWFMKTEEQYGFEAALDVDVAVWGIMPKIQARMLREMLALPDGMAGLRAGISEKMKLDGFLFSIVPDNGGFTILVQDCPWHEQMVKSGREHLSEHVGSRICSAEYNVWAAEFGDGIVCTIHERICNGCDSCRISFSANSGKNQRHIPAQSPSSA